MQKRIGLLIANVGQPELVYEPLALYCTGVCVFLTFHSQDNHIAHCVVIDLTLISGLQFIARNPFDIRCVFEQKISTIV